MMFNLTQFQKEEIGLNFVLNLLECQSPYGVEKARQIAPYGRGGAEKLAEIFDNIEAAYSLNDDDFNNFCYSLAHFKNIRGVIKKLETETLNEVELFEAKGFLLALEGLASGLSVVAFSGIALAPMEAALNLLDPRRQRLYTFMIADDFSPKLLEIRQQKFHLEGLLRQKPHDEGILEQRRAVAVAEDAEEIKVMQHLSAQLRPYINTFIENMENIGNLDLTLAKAKLAKNFDAIRPEICENNCVIFDKIFNPYVDNMLSKKGKQFTKISLNLPGGVTVITGANMGGKSIAIKTAILNVILCQMGFFVFADAAKISLFDGICLIDEDTEDIARGLSTFAAQITRLKEIIPILREKPVFLALDEPARATNPAEATAIVRGITAFLATQSHSAALLSTHYDNIAPLATAHYRVAGQNAENANIMDYTLHPASPDEPIPRNALNICKQLGLDEEILNKIEQN